MSTISGGNEEILFFPNLDFSFLIKKRDYTVYFIFITINEIYNYIYKRGVLKTYYS